MPAFTRSVLSIFAVSTLFSSCNNEDEITNKPEVVPVKIAPPVEDSVIAAMMDTGAIMKDIPRSVASFDSMMQLEVKIPPFLDEKAYDQKTIKSFETLAARTGGVAKVVAGAGMLAGYINNVVDENAPDYGDILFLIDNTGSMDDDIAAIKAGLSTIINTLKKKKNVRLGVATYRDKLADSTKWFSFRNFEMNLDAATCFIDSIVTNDGGDLPESVYEAYFEAEKKNFWRSSTKRVVLIIGDAGGHEKPEGEYSLNDMIVQATKNNIKVNFFPLVITPYSAEYRTSDAGPEPATNTRLIKQVYPNPAINYINMTFNAYGKYRIEVFTMTGIRVWDETIENDHWSVGMANQAEGLYVLRISDKNRQFDTAKFIVKR